MGNFKNNNSIEEEHMIQLTMLKNSLQKLYECEENGTNTLNNLNEQGEKIRSAKPKLQNINTNLDSSNNLLDKMKQWWRT
jgi:hypothetical protein